MAELEKLLCTDSKVESLKKINAIIENSGSGLQLFDTILKDHVLTYEETKGLALQGTYAYKEAIAGSRYGYPDFYNKVVEEFNEATNTETVNGVTIKVHSNGHKFYDIADKTAIDNYFNSMGSAWFYGVDTKNERVFLPRNNWFEQATLNESEVGQSVQAGLPNITGELSKTAGNGFFLHGSSAEITQSGALSVTSFQSTWFSDGAGSANMARNFKLDASKSNSTYGKSNTVQPKSVKKLLYICVGNTTNYEGITDVVNQGMEILEQVAQKVNVDGTNLNAEGKSLISGYALPSDNWISLTLGSAGSNYTAPANGYVLIRKFSNAVGQHLTAFNASGIGDTKISSIASQALWVWFPVKKGETFHVNYSAGGTTELFRFVYAQGEV